MAQSPHADSYASDHRDPGHQDRGLPVRLRDRVTGELVCETVYGESELGFLYHESVGRLLTDHLLTRRLPHHLYAWLKRMPRSGEALARFVEKYGIDMSEAERPLEEYRSLDALFTRKLRADARPIDADPDHLVSPVDCRAFAFSPLTGGTLPIKGNSCTLADVLDNQQLADRYVDGAAFVLRLAPADYHRFHFPAGGTALPARLIEGRLHSVHPIARAGAAPSLKNKRMTTRIVCERFGDLLQIEVGALTVGTIVQTFQPGPVEPGQEKGYFRYGGSAVLLVVEPGRVQPDEDLLANTREGLETIVKMGTRIAARPGR